MTDKNKHAVSGQFNVTPRPNKTKKSSWWKKGMVWDKRKMAYVNR